MINKVVIVEDDHLMAKMLTNIMKKKEYDVVLVITLSRLQEIDFADITFVISGINIVGGKTLEFWQQCRSAIPLILMSAMTPTHEDLVSIPNLVGFLEKPFDLGKLEELIDKVSKQ